MSDEYGQDYNPNQVNVSAYKPVFTVIGRFKGGALARVEWTQETRVISDRTLGALQLLGAEVIDDHSNYLFSGQML